MSPDSGHRLFLSCDWGTSSFRLRLVECDGLKTLAQVESAQGTAQTHGLWTKAAQPSGQRVAFYRAILQPHLDSIREAAAVPLDGVPIAMSGMASSSLGLRELPYKAMPFDVDGSDLLTELIAPAPDFAHPIVLISGACTAEDVMRGEETQLVGCRFERTPEAQLFLHPGTHAKHVQVRDGLAHSFRTYMTGEFFALLSEHSILAGSLEKGGTLEDDESHLRWFEQGVRGGRDGNLLHSAFAVRTNSLFGCAGAKENRFYLSGLLIGAECSELLKHPPQRITMAGEPELLAHYAAALRVLGIAARCPVRLRSAEQVTLEGQLAILQRH
jgi:2-dehydro-3-deoxygalactonokinase